MARAVLVCGWRTLVEGNVMATTSRKLGALGTACERSYHVEA